MNDSHGVAPHEGLRDERVVRQHPPRRDVACPGQVAVAALLRNSPDASSTVFALPRFHRPCSRQMRSSSSLRPGTCPSLIRSHDEITTLRSILRSPNAKSAAKLSSYHLHRLLRASGRIVASQSVRPDRRSVSRTPAARLAPRLNNRRGRSVSRVASTSPTVSLQPVLADLLHKRAGVSVSC